MPKFDVHIFAVVRVKVADVEAATPAEAAADAYDRTDVGRLLQQDRLLVPSGKYSDDYPGSPHRPGHRHVSYVEFADDYGDQILVDCQDDPQYERSEWFATDEVERLAAQLRTERIEAEIARLKGD
jgi:hypothetical protein